MASLEQLVLDICDPELRWNALRVLFQKRAIFQDLGPLLLNSYGTIAVLLQCVASHPETRIFFINASIPLYLYPFLNTTNKTKPFEYLRLTSLGVIGALVKVHDTNAVNFLIESDIMPLCLCSMENGSELSKTVATFIVLRILLDDIGLQYICATSDRFYAVVHILGAMVESVAEKPSKRLLKQIIGCYLRLTDFPRCFKALQEALPMMLKDGTFDSYFHDDPNTRCWLQQLLVNLHGEG